MNLNTATNEQLDAYREQTAKALNIDPLMLDYIYMDDTETGLRNRVLYAKRGAAEVLRQNLGISVLSMVPYESNGWLMFTATGQNPKGRQEIAHGAAYIEGSKADKKAHSVMTASTRALRRLTLQFVGGGILDETEVQGQSQLQSAPASAGAQLAGSAAVIPPPQVAISTAPGKDITPVPEFDKLPIISELAIQLPNTSDTVASAVKFSIEQQALRDEATAQLNAPKTRKRKQRNTVALESPGQQIEMPVGHIDAAGTITPAPIDAIAEHVKGSVTVAEIAKQVLSPVSTPAAPVLAPAPAASAVESVQPVAVPKSAEPPSLTPEKAKEYSDRIRRYSQDILPKAGMQPSEKIGGPTMKLRKFAAVYCGAQDSAKLTAEQFDDLLGFLDSYSQTNGATALVEYINKALGVV